MIQHAPLLTGQTVLTADKTRLGTIAEVRGPFLRIQRFLGRSYWLGMECILWVDTERVVMAFKAADLNRYRRKRRPPIAQPETAVVRVTRLNRSPYVRAQDAERAQ